MLTRSCADNVEEDDEQPRELCEAAAWARVLVGAARPERPAILSPELFSQLVSWETVSFI